MKYISEFRDGQLANRIANKIQQSVKADSQYHIMEFCGGHTHAIHRYGIPSLLPSQIDLIHGPGCPVCVLPIARIDYAVALSQLPNVIFCSYADMLRVPGSNQYSLLKAKAEGADVRMVYSVDDALQIAREAPNKEVIFFAIGFETTTPPTAAALIQAKRENLKNFTVMCNHVLTPVAMRALLAAESTDTQVPFKLDGFIGPAHVSIIIGSNAYQSVAHDYQRPIVISGFEPLDVMYSIWMLVEMINQGRFGVENQYTRAVLPAGNLISQQMIGETLAVRDSFEWRGLGWIPDSALKIQPAYAMFDAEIRFPMQIAGGQGHKACACGAILRGAKKPIDCSLFEKVCTPENPLGSCMVSSEGACAAYYAYGRHSVAHA
jgi:hydrogenase expression/formation protein HypD